jgi:aldehyde:ferredoxin oxidoreductase
LQDSAVPRSDLERAIPLYYEMMGWVSDTGVPQYGKLVELQIEWAEDHLPA